MGARLRVFLTPEQDRTLFEIRTATTVTQRVKDRAEVLRLSSQGWYVEEIATHFKWNVDTVRDAMHRWNKHGLGGLWDARHPGGKRRWQVSDIEYLEQALRDQPRTFNSQQLAHKLAAERKVTLSADRLRRILKTRGSGGSAPDRGIMPNKTPSKALSSKPTLRC